MAGAKTPMTVLATERRAAIEREGHASKQQAPQTAADVQAAFERAQASSTNPLLKREQFPTVSISRDEDYDGAVMVLDPRRVRAFDRNPRRTRNPKYDDIRASIKAHGVLNAVTITRRHGEREYMIYGGGNTRLEILQELVAQQPENPLYQLPCTFRAWKGEATALAAHFIENDARGDLGWWDKAFHYQELKATLESESNRVMTAADFRSRCAEMGLSVGRTTAQLLQFTHTNLVTIGPWVTQALAADVRPVWVAAETLIGRLSPSNARAPHLHELMLHALESLRDDLQAAADLADADQGAPPTVDHKGLHASIIDAVAQALGRERDVVGLLLAKLQANPQMTAAQLEAVQRFNPPLERRNAAHDVAESSTTVVQRLLPTPMLASVVATPKPAQSAAQPAAASETGLARPLGMNPLPADGPQAEGTDDELEVRLRNDVAAAATAFAEAGEVRMCLRRNADMPLGYHMDLADDRLEALASNPNPAPLQVSVRHTTWSLLAVLSGQFDAETTDHVPPDAPWSIALADGSLQQRLVEDRLLFNNGLPHLDSSGVFLVLTNLSLAPRFISLLRAIQALQQARRDHTGHPLLPLVPRGIAGLPF